MSSATAAPPGDRVPTVADAVARFIAAQGVKRTYSLPGSHAKPLWSALVGAGVRVISARSECAAVHMAHAEADLTGTLGVALVTAGPGLTNAVTGVASAYASRTPLLLLSARVPDAQSGMGALEEVPQAELVRPVCRYLRAVADARHVLPGLHLATAAALGSDGPAGPAYVDFDPGLLKSPMAAGYQDPLWFRPVSLHPKIPEPSAIEAAAELVHAAQRPVVIGGRAALASRAILERFLNRSDCLYLDTRESRGALPPDSPHAMPSMRARAIAEADLVITLGKRLDFELAYGSPAVFAGSARFLRIGRSVEELSENRRGDVEVCADVGLALEAMVRVGARPAAPDAAWREALVAGNAENVRRLDARLASRAVEGDGRMHPFTLIDAVNANSGPGTICVVDGGDILSFARVGLRAYTYLDLGPFGCLGCGVPYAVAAALAFPDRRVIALAGDGAFGFAAIEIETAVRNDARALFVVANNDAWNIERHDELANYAGQDLGTALSPCRYDRLAESLGAYGQRVERHEELADAFGRALARLPAVLDVAVSREATSPDFRSGLARIPTLQPVERWDEAERLWLTRGPDL